MARALGRAYTCGHMPSTAPIGRVALVFTDVQGSTALWEHKTDAMRIALEQHNTLMRSLLERAGGFEVKTEGDAFMLAFAEVRAAAQWCLGVQNGLLQLQWPPELLEESDAREELGDGNAPLFRGLRVRMGIHVGKPDCRPSPTTGRMDYFGPVVNRAARVAGAATGGQLVVSAEAWRDLAPQLAVLGSPVSLDLGEFQLKGLSVPERLTQLLPRQLAKRNFQKTTSVFGSESHQDEHFLAMLGKDVQSLDASGRMHGGAERPKTDPRLVRPVGIQSAPALELDLDRKQAPKVGPWAQRGEGQSEEAASAQGKRSRAPLVVGLAVLLVAGAVGAALLLRGRSDFATLGVAGGEGLVIFETTPDGATVAIGGVERGRTPLALKNQFPPGLVEVTFKKPGFAEQKGVFQGGSDVNATVRATMQPRK